MSFDADAVGARAELHPRHAVGSCTPTCERVEADDVTRGRAVVETEFAVKYEHD